jgi:hypothetical protein
MKYHNTTNTTGGDLLLFQVKTANQDQRVLQIFREHPAGLTADECHKLYKDFRVPLTSIRRAVTNLAEGYFSGHWIDDFNQMHVERLGEELVKTTEKRMGSYGRPCYVYKIK